MKKTVLEFMRRGLVSLGFGPLVLALIYMILKSQGIVETMSVENMCLGIFSISVLAFVAGGMNAIYQIERLPLMVAILIHGAVLYATYLLTYLGNGWLEMGWLPVLIFTGIFAMGYLVIWAVIYYVIRRNTKKLNDMLTKSRESRDAV